MVLLPRLVQETISSACHSDRQLSWKIQESAKGTLIQLVCMETSPNCCAKTEESQHGGQQLEYQLRNLRFLWHKVLKICLPLGQKRKEEIIPLVSAGVPNA